MYIRLLLVLSCLSITPMAHAQSEILGKWQSIDDNTGKTRAIVEVRQENGEYKGRIVELFRTPEQIQNPKCLKCPAPLTGDPVLGLEILTGLSYDSDDQEWVDGSIIDAETGKTYTCKAWVEDDNLMLRGYIAFFYRTVTWLPYEDEL